MFECKLCSCNEYSSRLEHVRDWNRNIEGEFTYCQCARCGCLQIEDFPQETGKYYANGYYSYQLIPDILWDLGRISRFLYPIREYYRLTGKGIGRIAYDLRSSFVKQWEPFRTCTWLDWLRTEPRFAIRRRSRILDVGCGTGNWLRYLRKAGFQNLTGADPFIEADLRVNSNLRILKKEITQLEGAYDMILLNHSLEHMPNQLEVMRSIERLLAPNGFAVIGIPIFSEYFYSNYGNAWFNFDPPRHFFMHSRHSFEMLCSQAGLKVKKYQYESDAGSILASRLNQMEPDLRKRAEIVLKNQFDPAEKNESEALARQLNSEEKSDRAVFFLVREP